jgi:hypothetical protein
MSLNDLERLLFLYFLLENVAVSIHKDLLYEI